MKKYFITGLVLLLPVALTVAVLIFIVNFLTGPFVGSMETFLHSQGWLEPFTRLPGARTFIHYFAQGLILILLFFFTILLGMITRWFFFRSFIKVGDKILHRIPLVNKIYKTTQDIIHTILTSGKQSFKTVVMVPFPHTGVYSLGFVSSEGPPSCRAAASKDLISVFVPTTPNPTSGFLMLFPREDCIFIPMKAEDALKFVISCGVLHESSSTVLENLGAAEATEESVSPAP